MTEDIEEILQKFPYRNWQSQEQKLAAILLDFPLPLKQVAAKRDGISEPTAYRIRDAYQSLEPEQKKQLVKHLAPFVDEVEP